MMMMMMTSFDFVRSSSFLLPFNHVRLKDGRGARGVTRLEYPERCRSDLYRVVCTLVWATSYKSNRNVVFASDLDCKTLS